MGRGEELGLAVGAVADLVTVRLDSVRTAGLDPDSMLAGVVYGASAADVHHVVSAGRVIVADGHHVAIDVVRELSESVLAVVGAS